MNANAATWYTWTAGPTGTFRNEQAARNAWNRYAVRCAARGSSAQTETIGQARLYKCRTRQMVRTVDVSTVRDGETIVAWG